MLTAHPHAVKGDKMKVTFSLFFLMTVIAGVLLYLKRIRIAAFLVSAIWGFMLSQSTAAPAVQNFLSSVARLFGAQ
jgi:hypothetical protein